MSKLRFTPHVICYLDVLGFKEKINGVHGDEEKEHELIKNYAFKAAGIKKLIEESSKGQVEGVRVSVISDSIIITCPISNLESIDEISSKLSTVAIASANFQKYLATYDIWIRGALSIGDICPSTPEGMDHLILGPGLIHTYLLEEKFAKYPRIILDPKVIGTYYETIQNFEIGMHNSTDHRWEGFKFMHRDKFCWENVKPYFDDLFFIDLYNGIHTDEVLFEKNYTVILDLVSRHLFSSPEVSEKFWWLGRYLFARLYDPNPDSDKVVITRLRKKYEDKFQRRRGYE